MNGPTTLLVLAGVIVFIGIVVKTVGRIASWRLTLTILAIAILAATGLLNIESVLGEIDYAITNLFGAPTEGAQP